MKPECEGPKSQGEQRPVNSWDKVHAIGIFILGITAVVMVGSSLIDRIAPATPQPTQQPVAPKTVNVLLPYGLPPVQTIDGKAVSCAVPATYEDLAHAFVCVCKAPKHPPIGSGVLVGTKDPNRLKVHLLTARHVAEACIAANGKDSVTFIVHRPNETNDFRKTYHGEDVRWGFATTGSDLAVVDVTQPFKTLRQEGVDVRYVFLQHTPLPVDDPAVVQGAFVIKRSDFEKYHLGIGTEVGVDAEIFKNTIRRIDERGCMIFPDGTKMTIQRWLEFGQVFTETLCQGCRIPEDLKKDVAKTAGDIAKAETLRDFLKGYIEVAEMDFRLRNAPARFKTKLFRDTLRLVNALVAMGEKV